VAPLGNPVQFRQLQGSDDIGNFIRNAEYDAGRLHIRPDHLPSQHQRGSGEGNR
jgi:hypothetical protein